MAKQKKMNRILLVDDEPVVGESIGCMLNFLGYEVKLASGAQEALNNFKNHAFDLVITDYGLPGMKGDALAEAIKQLNPEQPVLLVSGFAEHLATSGLNAADMVIGKPFELGELKRAVSELCLVPEGQNPQV